MAFNQQNFKKVFSFQPFSSSFAIPSPHTIWAYDAAGDAYTDVDDSGYFATVGSTTGEATIKDGDIIFTWCDTDNATKVFTLFIVSDDAAGTAIQVSGAFNTSKVGVSDYDA